MIMKEKVYGGGRSMIVVVLVPMWFNCKSTFNKEKNIPGLMCLKC